MRQYRRRMDNALGPGAVPVDHIAALHDLGYLPVRIKALPEGSRVNIKVPLFTVRNPQGIRLADQLPGNRAVQFQLEADHGGHHRP